MAENKSFFKERVIYWLAIVILILFCFYQCRSKRTINIVPDVPSPVSIIERVIHDTIESGVKQSVYDSTLAYYKNRYERLQTEKYLSERKLEEVLDDNANLARKVENKQQQLDLLSSNDLIREQIRKNDSICRERLSLFRGQLQTWAGKYKECQELNKKVLANLDTALNAQQKLSDYAKSMQPRTTLFIGAHLIGNKEKWINGAGVHAGLIFKKGTIVTLSATQIQSITNFGLGVSKEIRLRKK